MNSSRLSMKFPSQKDMIAAGVTYMKRYIDVMDETFPLPEKTTR